MQLSHLTTFFDGNGDVIVEKFETRRWDFELPRYSVRSGELVHAYVARKKISSKHGTQERRGANKHGQCVSVLLSCVPLFALFFSPNCPLTSPFAMCVGGRAAKNERLTACQNASGKVQQQPKLYDYCRLNLVKHVRTHRLRKGVYVGFVAPLTMKEGIGVKLQLYRSNHSVYILELPNNMAESNARSSVK